MVPIHPTDEEMMDEIENPGDIQELVRDYEYWLKRKEWKEDGKEAEYVKLYGGSIFTE